MMQLDILRGFVLRKYLFHGINVIQQAFSASTLELASTRYRGSYTRIEMIGKPYGNGSFQRLLGNLFEESQCSKCTKINAEDGRVSSRRGRCSLVSRIKQDVP